MDVTDEPYRVYVSRIPLHWSEELFYEHFVTLAFGDVKRVELFTSRGSRKNSDGKCSSKQPSIGLIKYCYTFKNHGSCDNPDCQYAPCNGISLEKDRDRAESMKQNEDNSLGSGLVVFEDEKGMQNALNQKSIHVSKKIIRISPYLNQDSRDTTICFAWTQYRCKHSDCCKFLHTGPGAVEKQSQPYQGRAFQCLSFRTKGKCSKGDACQFLHIESDNNRKRNVQTEDSSIDEASKKKGVCNVFKKKGKCRKGDRCPYNHVIQKQNELDSNKGSDPSSKKRKIDGKYLVEMRTGSTKITFQD